MICEPEDLPVILICHMSSEGSWQARDVMPVGSCARSVTFENSRARSPFGARAFFVGTSGG